jgi:hypothetical protein
VRISRQGDLHVGMTQRLKVGVDHG